MKRIVFCLLVLLFCSCEKRQLQVYMLEFYNEEVICGRFSVSITVDYKYPAKLDYVNCSLSIYSDMSDAISTQAVINDKRFTVRLENLIPNTIYYYQYEYYNGIDLITTSIKNFTTDDYGLPIVETSEVTAITYTSATSGGDIIDDGGLTLTARGVCWSKSPNPTTSDAHSNDGIGIGSYTSQLTPLSDNTTYYVRAYAINSIGTSYGEQKTFKILPYGSINGLFSVSSSSTKKVYFSQGNLQYQASTNTWRFAERQCDYIGNDNQNISPSYSGWIDLFGWGTGNDPTKTSTNSSDYLTFKDWGNNTISNGGSIRWFTLTENEWRYIFNGRSTNSGIRYANAILNGIKGVVLLPDNWSSSYYNLSGTNNAAGSFTSNRISISDWNTIFETNGAVFLPTAGRRMGTNVFDVNSQAAYWSATHISGGSWISVYIGDYTIPSCNSSGNYGSSVRLVCSAE